MAVPVLLLSASEQPFSITDGNVCDSPASTDCEIELHKHVMPDSDVITLADTNYVSDTKHRLEYGTESETESNAEDSEKIDTKGHRQRVGLVLSGGGAKGIAHVGVIKALEDNNIPIDYVAGTSMGSIVGSLYSCGWSPQKMLDLFTSQNFLDWSQGIINKKYLWYYYQPDPTPKWVSFNLSFSRKQKLADEIIPTSLVSPLPMNIEFLNLYGPYSEQCDENFNNLFVPFRCVASDVYHKHKVVFSKGSLGDAVRASMSFPMVFRPISIDGNLLYDGGIYDNFPVNVMEEDFNPDFIIGVSVAGADSKPRKGDMYNQLEDMIIQNNDYSLPADKGIKIQVPVLNFGVLQFNKARTIYEIGYQTGLRAVDSIKSRLRARMPLQEVNERRRKFAEATPELQFDSVTVTGVRGSQARYLEYLFTGGRSGKFGMPQTIDAYYRAVTDGSLSNLLPGARFGKDDNNTLVLDATPRRPWTLSVGGYVTTSTNSMLYFSGAYHTLGLNSLDVTASAWIGQAYFAGMARARFALRTSIPSYVELTGVLSKQRYYAEEVLFYKTSDPLFTTEVDNFLRAGYVWAIGRRMKGYASLAGGYLSDSYFPGEGAGNNGRRDVVKYGVGVFRAGIEANDLDNQMYPSAGSKWFVNIDMSLQRSRYKAALNPGLSKPWHTRPVATLEAMWQRYFPLSRKMVLGSYIAGAATLQKLDQNYTNTLMHAIAFAPTPATQNYFNLAFRSDNYAAVGLIPIWKPFKSLQLRGDFYAYLPVRHLENNGPDRVASFNGWLHPVRFLGELAAVYNFPFVSIAVYGNYLSYPARNWNFGISFGLLFRAPRLLRK